MSIFVACSWAARFTGCRPAELRTLIWEWVDLEAGFWVYPDHKTLTQQTNPMPRTIPLPDPVWKMCRQLAKNNPRPEDHVFLNAQSTPFTKDALCRRIARIRERAGIKKKNNEQLVHYSTRHSFATDTVGKVSDLELATLMGHTDTKMIRRYVHLNAHRLRDIQRRAQKK